VNQRTRAALHDAPTRYAANGGIVVKALTPNPQSQQLNDRQQKRTAIHEQVRARPAMVHPASTREEPSMSEHIATVTWQRSGADFTARTYNRSHEWKFDSGVVVAASASPLFRGDADRVDPEEALVAALSSCHMLTFLFDAAQKNLVVDSYEDTAVGVMTKNERGTLWVSRVTLRPKIRFGGGSQPSAEQLAAMHEHAHEHCFIAQSVKTEVVVE
jgi:organic hydroperoxide reductase OsmC/OhrA